MYQSDNTEMYLSVFKYSGGYICGNIKFLLEGIEGQEEGHPSRKEYNLPSHALVLKYNLVYVFECILYYLCIHKIVTKNAPQST